MTDEQAEQLHHHAEAMADALEDLCYCEHDDEMWQRAKDAWQTYVDWARETFGVSSESG